jgi:hypothetical protein
MPEVFARLWSEHDTVANRKLKKAPRNKSEPTSIDSGSRHHEYPERLLDSGGEQTPIECFWRASRRVSEHLEHLRSVVGSAGAWHAFCRVVNAVFDGSSM